MANQGLCDDARRQRILHTELAELLLQRFMQSDEPQEPVALDSIRACMEKLAPQSKEVIQGRYRKGLTAPQLADRMGLTAANVRQMLVRIRRQLKQCVELRMTGEQ